ncbi:ATP-binding protein [Halorhodospira halophila]|uniref:ATP-binding protein n=1 Tax=Halorhodospira halophila TaxID=1053 RepID=UPI0002FEF978|nr:ATP-binding protein [Halorhodospira halophila]
MLQRGLRLNWQLDERLPEHVYADPTRLGQILANLVGNAIKFTEHGSVDVHITPQHDQRISFRVADTGPGIPESIRATIFEPFARGDQGVPQTPGTGLGLAICRELVGLMGGRIDVESAEGRGTTFSFTVELPACDAIVPAAVDTDRPRTPSRPGAHHDTPQAILAEDEPTNALLLSTLLERAGWAVTTVTDGAEAVEAWQEAQPELMILDMQMPHTNGDQAAARIRSLEQQHRVPRTPIVMLTAHALDDVRERARQAGCDHYLTKPVAPEDLYSVLDWAQGGDGSP